MFSFKRHSVRGKRAYRPNRKRLNASLAEADVHRTGAGRALKVECIIGGFRLRPVESARATRDALPGDSAEQCGKLYLGLDHVSLEPHVGLITNGSDRKVVERNLIGGADLIGLRFLSSGPYCAGYDEYRAENGSN